ncbi:uncharacterized protein LOC134829029 [Culicoides brevitarsis]|uniref:uncharacterized protein LOC134829029 n=1 Tax=Culicoides brevitarsis TaxID=469753 RepID=UPI00307CA196
MRLKKFQNLSEKMVSLPKKCCFYCELQTGGVILGWIGVATAVFSVILAMIGIAFLQELSEALNEYPHENITDHHPPSVYPHTVAGSFLFVMLISFIILNLVALAASICLIMGSIKNKHMLLIPWMVSEMGSIIILALGFIVDLISIDVEGVPVSEKVLGFVATLSVLVLDIYLWLCIYALYKKIKHETTQPMESEMVTNDRINDGLPAYKNLAYSLIFGCIGIISSLTWIIFLSYPRFSRFEFPFFEIFYYLEHRIIPPYVLLTLILIYNFTVLFSSIYMIKGYLQNDHYCLVPRLWTDIVGIVTLILIFCDILGKDVHGGLLDKFEKSILVFLCLAFDIYTWICIYSLFNKIEDEKIQYEKFNAMADNIGRKLVDLPPKYEIEVQCKKELKEDEDKINLLFKGLV